MKRILNNGTEVQQGGQAVDFTTGFTVTESNGVATVAVKDAGIDTTQLKDAGVTPAKYNRVEAITASTDGTGTGQISANTTHAVVTSAGSTKVVTLPAPVVGRILVIDVGSNGFKLQSTAPASIAINGGTGASAVSAIAASSTILAICISATAWKAIYLDADSDVAKVAAAA